jgi:hypothetical protein
LSELAGVDARFNPVAVEPAIAFDVEAIGAAGDRAMAVDQADSRGRVEERADVPLGVQNASMDFELVGFRQAREAVFYQLPLGTG